MKSRDELDLDLGWSDRGSHLLSYEPLPPLDIDPRPIDGDQLREWRKSQPARTDKPDRPESKPYATISTISERFGFSGRGTWGNFERNGVKSPLWAALIREWVEEDCEFDPPIERAPVEQVRALAQLVGGLPALSRALGVHETRADGWARSQDFHPEKRSGAPISGGAGPLIRYLFDDLGLEPVETIDRSQCSGRAKLEAHEVREIVRRYDGGDGETIAEIAADYPVQWSAVWQIVDGQSYQWVTGGQS